MRGTLCARRRRAEQLQRQTHLPDGVAADEYGKKALAFLIHIRPNLSQTYDDEDTSEYLIWLMPKSLRSDGRRITTELKNEGKYTDHMLPAESGAPQARQAP